jgi:Sigma-70, region 4
MKSPRTTWSRIASSARSPSNISGRRARTCGLGCSPFCTINTSIAKLPDEQRTVILLVGLEGMRYEAVAEIIGVPVGTVRSRLSRGREALRRLMGIIPDRQAEAIMARPGVQEQSTDVHIAA